MKLCKDCKHHCFTLGDSCARKQKTKISPVDGKEINFRYDELPLCTIERQDIPKVLVRLFGLCGPEARFFEPKEK